MRKSRPTTKPKLLAVDLDGTLLDSFGTPHRADARAIEALLASGIPVAIITGRLYSGSRATAQSLGIEGPIGCVDGSHIVRASNHETLLHRGIAGDDARELRSIISRHWAATFLFAEDSIVHDDRGAPYLPYVATWSRNIRRAPFVSEHEHWEADAGITGIVSVGHESAIGPSFTEICEKLGGRAQALMFPIAKVPGMYGMIVRAHGGTKGTALAWIAKHHGVSIDEAVCVGDWLNDVSMLEIAGWSFAMGHAPDAVKAISTHVLAETNRQGGGVAAAIALAFGVRA